MRKRSTFLIRLAAALALGGGLFACDSVLGIDKLSRGVCNEGERQCRDDNTPHICKSGVWEALAPCGDRVCMAGACAIECEDGSTRCSLENVPQLCVSGELVDQEPCVGQTCQDGKCVGECAPGGKRCLGDTPQGCDLGGQWVSGASCGEFKPCLGGECIGVCVPGDVRCFSDQPQICDATGSWAPNGPIGDICGCNAATGQSLPDGFACDDGSPCTMNDTCQGGLCNPGADHTWAHWDLAEGGLDVRFVVSGEVVFDKLIRRVWQRAAPTGAFTWSDASAYCACLNDPNDGSCAKVAGYPSGWRLPTRIELAAIVDPQVLSPAIDEDAFPGVGAADTFWTSSPYADGAGFSAWMVSFARGDVDSASQSLALRVRCVR